MKRSILAVIVSLLAIFAVFGAIHLKADSRISGDMKAVQQDTGKKPVINKQPVQKSLLKEFAGKTENQSSDKSSSGKFIQFLMNPVMVTLLLTVASLGLVLELFSPGFGISGVIGAAALLLYFYSHLASGQAGIESVVLFIIGLLLIAAEFFLPGAVAGMLGLAAVIASLLMAGGNITYTAVSLAVALAVTLIGMLFMIKVLKKRMDLFKKIVLNDSANSENGYVSNVNRVELLGKTGITITALRPAGTMLINDERLDVVSEGSYISKDEIVKVVKVEGARIVVRPLQTGGNASVHS